MFNNSNFALNLTKLFLSRNLILTNLKHSQRITFIYRFFGLRSAIECVKTVSFDLPWVINQHKFHVSCLLYQNQLKLLL